MKIITGILPHNSFKTQEYQRPFTWHCWHSL